MSKSNLDPFLEERTDTRYERNRTINIPESVHSFYKNTANNFDVKITSLITNVLLEWKDSYGDEIKDELIKRIRRRGF